MDSLISLNPDTLEIHQQDIAACYPNAVLDSTSKFVICSNKQAIARKDIINASKKNKK